jgi:hypothetical protein
MVSGGEEDVDRLLLIRPRQSPGRDRAAAVHCFIAETPAPAHRLQEGNGPRRHQ